MPTRDMKGGQPGGMKPLWKRDDKCVQAEMKNKIETSRFRLRTKLLDKEKMHTGFMIDKDKRMMVKQIRRTRLMTSGISSEGEPPEGPEDTLHLKSPYFQSGTAVSEKRLQKWRITERQLERDRKTMEEELKPPWQKVKIDPLSESFRIVMGLMGYEQDVIDDVISKSSKEIIEERKKNSKENKEVCLEPTTDVFQSLRREEQDYFPLNDSPFQSNSSSSFGASGSFSVGLWERDLVKHYQSKITRPLPKHKGRIRRTYSAPVHLVDQDGDTPGERHVNGKVKGGKENVTYRKKHTPPATRIRPQTADSKRTRTVLQPRPKSAEHSSNGNRVSVDKQPEKRSLYMNSHGDKIHDSTDSNGITRQTSTSSIGGYGRNPSDDEPKANITDINMVQGHDKDESLNGASELVACNGDLSLDLDSQNSKLKENTSTVSFKADDIDSSPKSMDRGRAENQHKNEHTPYTGSVSSDDETSPVPPKPSSKFLANRRSTVTVAQLQRNRNKIVSFQDNLTKANNVHSVLQTAMPMHKNLFNRRSTLTTSVLKTDQFQAPGTPVSSSNGQQGILRRGSAPVIREGGTEENQVVEPRARLPQWRRDLLAEAPPGTHGNKGPVKVKVIMSKSQRRRELEKLVDDNVSDVRKIVGSEQNRRMASRQNVFMTMMKVRQAVDSLTNVPEEGEAAA